MVICVGFRFILVHSAHVIERIHIKPIKGIVGDIATMKIAVLAPRVIRLRIEFFIVLAVWLNVVLRVQQVNDRDSGFCAGFPNKTKILSESGFYRVDAVCYSRAAPGIRDLGFQMNLLARGAWVAFFNV